MPMGNLFFQTRRRHAFDPVICLIANYAGTFRVPGCTGGDRRFHLVFNIVLGAICIGLTERYSGAGGNTSRPHRPRRMSRHCITRTLPTPRSFTCTAARGKRWVSGISWSRCSPAQQADAGDAPPTKSVIP